MQQESLLSMAIRPEPPPMGGISQTQIPCKHSRSLTPQIPEPCYFGIAISAPCGCSAQSWAVLVIITQARNVISVLRTEIVLIISNPARSKILVQPRVPLVWKLIRSKSVSQSSSIESRNENALTYAQTASFLRAGAGSTGHSRGFRIISST